MASRGHVDRTVQFWRLVDAATGELLEEQDWRPLLYNLQRDELSFNLSGKSYAGTVTTVDVPQAFREALTIDGPVGRSMPTTSFGFVLAGDKDYVPNQRHATRGTQQPMQLSGPDWEPVDNLFAWFAPFGNFVAVLAESTSSSRAATLADWLSRATVHYGGDAEFAFAARPVVDRSQLERLARASRLKSIVYAGEIGNGIHTKNGLTTLFSGPAERFDALRIEVKVTTLRGKGQQLVDQRELLEWYHDTFGQVTSSVSKAQVTVVNDDEPPSEIDLIQNRLTRKTSVRINTGSARAFTATAATHALIEAFALDREALLRLRYNED